MPSSLGSLQIHKPAAGPGAPNLKVVKSGPATAFPGDFITYTLAYTNQATGTNAARGVQMSDILPPQVIVDTNTLAGGRLTGNTIYWDLSDGTNLPPGFGSQLSFQVQLDPATPFGSSFTNFSQILSAENDADYSDNTSTWVTTIPNCTRPTVLVNPSSATRCPGSSVAFISSASGSAPLSYQWLKSGITIPGATNNSFSISSVSSGDAASYALVVANTCGSVTSAPSPLIISTNASATALTSLVKCPGDSATFGTAAGGTGPFFYVWRKNGSPVSDTNNTLTIPFVVASDAGIYSVEVTG